MPKRRRPRSLHWQSQYLKKANAAIQHWPLWPKLPATAVYPTALSYWARYSVQCVCWTAATFQQYLMQNPVCSMPKCRSCGRSLTLPRPEWCSICVWSCFASDQISDPVFQRWKSSNLRYDGDQETRCVPSGISIAQQWLQQSAMNNLAGRNICDGHDDSLRPLSRIPHQLTAILFAYADWSCGEPDVPWMTISAPRWIIKPAVQRSCRNCSIATQRESRPPWWSSHFLRAQLMALVIRCAINEWDKYNSRPPDDSYSLRLDENHGHMNKQGYDQPPRRCWINVARTPPVPKRPHSSFMQPASRRQQPDFGCAVTFEVSSMKIHRWDAYRALYLVGWSLPHRSLRAGTAGFSRVLVLGTNAARPAIGAILDRQVQQKQNTRCSSKASTWQPLLTPALIF